MRPLNILLAEDERSVAVAVTFALKLAGHQITVASNGEQALARLDAEQFDVLITDNNMPGMSGLELVRRVRSTEFGGYILVLSAHLSPENRAAYHKLAVDRMLPKPFDLHALRDAIDSLHI